MTSGDQRDDFMMREIRANDLRLEMAHLSQCGLSVHKKDKLRTICEHCVLVVLCQHVTFTFQDWLVSHKLMPEAPSKSKGFEYRSIQ